MPRWLYTGMSAKLLTTDDRPALRLERRLKHAPEKVWRAITDPAELAHWFPARVDVDLRDGGAIRFTFPGEDTTTTGRVVAADPPREFTFVWNDDTLRWLISPDVDGTRVEFTESPEADVPAQLARRHEQLDRLFAATFGVDLPDWTPDRVDAVKKHYAGG